VGMELNPDKRNFDHHGVDAPDDLSTIALLFKHIFPYYREDNNLLELYNRLVMGISDWDTGNISLRNLNKYPLYLPQLISGFNRDGEVSQDIQFIKAVQFAYTVLANEINTAKEIVLAKEIWDKKKIVSKSTVLLEKYCTFWRTVQEKPEYKYIIQPESGNWTVVSVNNVKYPLPEINHRYSDKVVFQHKNRFLTVFKELKDALDYVSEFDLN
jgi:uncharacterized UPF0160 family protein